MGAGNREKRLEEIESPAKSNHTQVSDPSKVKRESHASWFTRIGGRIKKRNQRKIRESASACVVCERPRRLESGF